MMGIRRPEKPIPRDSCCSDDASIRNEEFRHRSAGGQAVEINTSGQMILPQELSEAYGFLPGIQLHVEKRPEGLLLRRPVTHLARIYVEPTGCCNLACRTCLRNSTNEPGGHMSEGVFASLLDGIRAVTPPPSVVFGGYGEPLLHPSIAAMIAAVRKAGAQADLITNATQLDSELSRQLIDAGLDRIWISLDGATPASYARIRKGGVLEQVIDNVRDFHAVVVSRAATTSIGFVFVAMQSNVQELPELLRLADRLHARRILVSNVIAYSESLRDQSLFSQSLPSNPYPASERTRTLVLPRMDSGSLAPAVLEGVFHSGWTVDSLDGSMAAHRNHCPFIESGSTAVRHDGRVSPCLPLMHDHTCHILPSSSQWHECIMGDLGDSALSAVWSSEEYTTFRRRVQEFQFAPCLSCAGCDMSTTNRDDCFGNGFPSCGTCPWAQGFVMCP